MITLTFCAALAVAAFLIAWVTNGFVGFLSGERPRDTGSLWLDIFLKFFALLELGFVGRILNQIGLVGFPRKVCLFIGLLCLLIFLGRACRHQPQSHTYTYPVTAQTQ